jgi:replicative DNA helicase
MRGGTKRPLLSDLRESGAIEQDADMVLFIHRQEKFGIPAFEDGSSTKGIAEIILAKNRNGPVDDVRLRFRDEKAQFSDIDEFDLEGALDIREGSQSITLGSKMNHDNFRKLGGEFDHDTSLRDEPPFA